VRLPIDTSSLEFMYVLAPVALGDAEALPVEPIGASRARYPMSVVALGLDGAQVMPLTVVEKPGPQIRQGTFVRVRGMSAHLSRVGGGSLTVSFSAEAVQAVGDPEAEGPGLFLPPGEGR
jgi:hypothetical protein